MSFLIMKTLSLEELKEFRKREKEQMWLNNPRCVYCGKITKYIENDPKHKTLKTGILPEDYPTVEHLYPKTDLRRYCKRGAVKTISCFKCNNERSKTNINGSSKMKEGLLIDIYNGLYDNQFII